MRTRHLLLAAAFALAAVPATAQVTLTLTDGRVTLVATQATPRQILTEWARIGQTRIVNIERLAGAPISLELTDIPEKQALDIILRSSSGYLAAPRAAAVANTSYYDRIFLIPGTPQPRTASSSSAPPMLPQPRVQAFPTEPDLDPPANVQRPPIVTPPPAAAPLVPPPAQPAIVPTAVAPPTANTPAPSTPNVPTGARAPGMIVQPPPAPGTPGASPGRP
jgi:hypothetical protein